MRRIVFGLLLVSLIACCDVLAEDVQAPNTVPPNANTGSPQQVQANKKLPSGQISSPSRIDRPKNLKQTSTARSRGPSAPPALPLSSAETYASEHPGNLAISQAPKPAPPARNSWTGFYVGAGVGAQP